MFMSMVTTDEAKHGHHFTLPFATSPSDASPSPSTRSPLSIFNLASWRPQAPGTPLELPPAVLASGQTTPNGTKANRNIMFAEPEASHAVSFEQPRPTSSSSTSSSEKNRKKRTPRTKTTYNLAHPPPPTAPSKKLHLRPKVYLQLQQVLPSRRPKPVYEVIPSAVFVPRLARKFARVFKSKDKLGPSDLLVVKAEQYGLNDGDDISDDERFSSREVIGVICVGKKEDNKPCKTEILMDDSSNWEASPMPNGGYEFICTDEHGLQLKCRWIARQSASRRASLQPSSGSVDDKKFTFSTISTNSRRHPIIASMTRSRIEIYDSYTMPSATSSQATSPVLTPLETPSVLLDSSYFLDAVELNAERRSPIVTDNSLRKLITVTGIWVGFCEGWSNVFNYNKLSCLTPLTTSYPTPNLPSSSKPRPTVPSRVVSMPVLDFPASTPTPTFPDEQRRTLPGLLRSSTTIINRNSTGRTPSPSAATSAATSASPTAPEPITCAKRSNSTSSAFSSRGRNSFRKRFGLPPEEQSLPESSAEREREKSMELFRNSLAQAPPPIRIDRATPEPSPTPSPTKRAKTTRAANSIDFTAMETAGLWGERHSTEQRVRPTSMVVDEEMNGKAVKRKGGRLRRILGVFKKGNHGS